MYNKVYIHKMYCIQYINIITYNVLNTLKNIYFLFLTHIYLVFL